MALLNANIFNAAEVVVGHILELRYPYFDSKSFALSWKECFVKQAKRLRAFLENIGEIRLSEITADSGECQEVGASILELIIFPNNSSWFHFD